MTNVVRRYTFYEGIVSEIAAKVPVYERPAIGIVMPRAQSDVIVRKRQKAIFSKKIEENACILCTNLFNLLSA